MELYEIVLGAHAQVTLAAGVEKVPGGAREGRRRRPTGLRVLANTASDLMASLVRPAQSTLLYEKISSSYWSPSAGCVRTPESFAICWSMKPLRSTLIMDS